MLWISILMFSLMIGVRIVQHVLTVRENKVSNRNLQDARSNLVKRLIAEREIRSDLVEFEESKFWELMDQIHDRSQTSFKNSLGVFRDLISDFSAQELIQLDNLLHRLFIENLNIDICAASTIIFRTTDPYATQLLMDLLMTRGEVFFKNACINPNLIIGKEFKDINENLFQYVVFDCYYKKSGKFMPISDQEDSGYLVDLPEESWTEEKLKDRYPELWFNFIGDDQME